MPHHLSLTWEHTMKSLFALKCMFGMAAAAFFIHLMLPNAKADDWPALAAHVLSVANFTHILNNLKFP